MEQQTRVRAIAESTGRRILQRTGQFTGSFPIAGHVIKRYSAKSIMDNKQTQISLKYYTWRTAN